MQLVEDDDVKTMIALYCWLDGEKGSDNEDGTYHQGEDFSDFIFDEVLDDINDEGIDNDDNVDTPSLGNPTHDIVIGNDPLAYILSVDPNVVYASEFQEYLNIIPSHRLVPDPKSKEFVIGQ
ncbi:hypothetical protein GOBAR_DD21040 [Gossypium barbadense]|nr:hypothetical protein GOBAR_DD21040 [Gossypium barbadense]